MTEPNNTARAEAILSLISLACDPDAAEFDAFKKAFMEHLEADPEGQAWLREAQPYPDDGPETAEHLDTGLPREEKHPL